MLITSGVKLSGLSEIVVLMQGFRLCWGLFSNSVERLPQGDTVKVDG